MSIQALEFPHSGLASITAVSDSGVVFFDLVGSFEYKDATRTVEHAVSAYLLGDGRYLDDNGGTVVLIERDGRRTSLFEGDRLAIAPDHQRIAAFAPGNVLVVYDLRTRQLRRLAELAPYGWRGAPRWSCWCRNRDRRLQTEQS